MSYQALKEEHDEYDPSPTDEIEQYYMRHPEKYSRQKLREIEAKDSITRGQRLHMQRHIERSPKVQSKLMEEWIDRYETEAEERAEGKVLYKTVHIVVPRKRRYYWTYEPTAIGGTQMVEKYKYRKGYSYERKVKLKS